MDKKIILSVGYWDEFRDKHGFQNFKPVQMWEFSKEEIELIIAWVSKGKRQMAKDIVDRLERIETKEAI